MVLTTIDLATDPRIDPCIRATFGRFGNFTSSGDVQSREELLAQENSESALKGAAILAELMNSMDTEEIAPSEGLTSRTEVLTSHPDGNSVKILFIRPHTEEVLPLVHYLHGRKWRRSPPTTAITARGGASSPRAAWPSPSSTSATPSGPRRHRRSPRSPRG